MADKIKFIAVGCGGIMHAWAATVFPKYKDDIELVAACDPIPAAFNKLKQYGYGDIPTFTDLSEAISNGVEANAALILTPPSLHVRYAREALQNEMHVLSEKPFFLEMEDFRCVQKELIPLAEENNLTAVVNQQYRWMPRIQDIRKALDANAIGDIGFVISHFTQNKYHFNSWWRQTHGDISQANWFLHHYDTMRYILQRNPVTVQARLFRPAWSKIYGESTIFLNVTFEDGIQWEYTGVQEGVGDYEDSGQSTFTIYGSKGCIRNTKDRPALLCLDKGNPHDPEVTELGPFRPEDKISTDSSKADIPGVPKYPPGWEVTMKYFIDAVRSKNEKPHPTNFRDNLQTLAIILCARESWRRNGAPVNVKDYLGLDPR